MKDQENYRKLLSMGNCVWLLIINFMDFVKQIEITLNLSLYFINIECLESVQLK